MSRPPLSLLTYWAIAANACAAFLMSNYLLSSDYVGITVVVSLLTFASYTLGHRFASTGKQLPRKPYLLVLAIYTGLVALPPMARMKAAIFAYALARLLMFRAVWLTDRREAYVHLLLYFAVVATCFGHWRADWSLLPLLIIYACSLVAALTLLHQDSQPVAPYTIFPWSSMLGALPLVTVITIVLLLITPLLPGPHLQLFPDIPRIGNSSDPATGAGGLEDLLNGMAHQPTKANPQSPFLAPVMEALQALAKLAGQAEALASQLHSPQKILQWLLPLLIIVASLHVLQRQQQRIRLWFYVRLWDPWQMRRLSRKKPMPSHAVDRLHNVFERLWDYYGLARSHDQTPVEHLHAIHGEYQIIGRPSTQLVHCFQNWRYGDQPAGDLTVAFRSYEQVRLVLSMLHRKSASKENRTKHA